MHVSTGALCSVKDNEAVFFNAVIQKQLFEAIKKSDIYFSQGRKCQITVEIL